MRAKLQMRKISNETTSYVKLLKDCIYYLKSARLNTLKFEESRDEEEKHARHKAEALPVLRRRTQIEKGLSEEPNTALQASGCTV